MSSVAVIPRIELQVDGVALSSALMSSFEEVRVQQRLSQPTVCELVFVLPNPLSTDPYDFRVGSEVSLSLPENSSNLFRGEITAVEHLYNSTKGQTIRIRCYNRLHRLRKRQPVRVHVQVTPGELARELTVDLGIKVESHEDGPLIQRLLQYRQSDFDLLLDVSRRCGLYIFLHGSVLHLLSLEGMGTSIGLKFGENLFEARLEVNGESACRSVVAKGWDASKVEGHESRVERPRSGRKVPASAPPDRFGSDGQGTMTGLFFPDDLHARAAAQGELDALTAREVTFSGTASGSVALIPGARIDVKGVSPGFTGSYTLTTVDHVINRQKGFISELSTVPPQRTPPSTGAVVVWGTVTSVDDPEKMGRVRAWLPAVGKIETDWMGVMAAGAGGSKGLVILPDVGDQVLILFVGGDASQAIVLGGLYGTEGPGDYGVEGSSVRRYSIGTSGGQRIQLDDSGQFIRMENKGGSYMEFSPEKFLIHSSVPFEIEAPGSSIVIGGKSIDFRQI
jgi:phage baseplate assembly protein V